jgi:hypothetical protein
MSDKKKIGALWKKITKQGKTILTGTVEIDGRKTPIAVFLNSYKDEQKAGAPDFVIYLDEYNKPAAQPQTKPAAAFPGEEPVDEREAGDDEIPF